LNFFLRSAEKLGQREARVVPNGSIYFKFLLFYNFFFILRSIER